MFRHRPRSRLLWLAFAAILWGSLVPAWSGVFAAPSGNAWIEVCTSQGPRLIAADPDGTPAGHPMPSGMECAWCRMPQEPPDAAFLPAAPSTAEAPPHGMPTARLPWRARRDAPWSAPPSRAPPRLS